MIEKEKTLNRLRTIAVVGSSLAGTLGVTVASHAQVVAFDEDAAIAGLNAIATGTQDVFWTSFPGAALIWIGATVFFTLIGMAVGAFIARRRKF